MFLRITALVLALAASACVLAQGADDAASGQQTFDANCAACHQANGRGVPAAFPPLAGHVPNLLAAEGGRAYLVRVVLFGLQGAIDVEGATFDGVMPSWSQLDDAAIAAVLNHVTTGWGNGAQLPEAFEPFTPDEVAAARGEALTADQVHALRGELTLAGAGGADGAQAVALAPVWYNAAQADEAASQYQRRCVECHGDRMEGGIVGGPPLRGATFEQHWGGGTAAALYGYLSTRMPQDRPGSLTEQTYVNLLSYILRGNGYPAGPQPLSADLTFLEGLTLDR